MSDDTDLTHALRAGLADFELTAEDRALVDGDVVSTWDLS